MNSGISTTSKAIRAKWILTAETPPIRDGLLVVDQGRIAFVGDAPGEIPSSSAEQCAILPAFVNAHTHLEFSSLTEPLGTPSLPFPDWIRRVISWRRERDQEGADGIEQYRRAVRKGLEECKRSGTSAIGEIATSSLSHDEMAEANAMGVTFLELIGLSPERVSTALEQARNFIQRASQLSSLTRIGLSPHAPYTVHPNLLRELVRTSAAQQIPLAMHLAETQEELQLLNDGTGPLRDLLSEVNAWDPSAFRRGTRPLDFLELLIRSHHALVVHGNYLSSEELSFVGRHCERLTIVYCPRTHASFGHAPYPLKQLIGCGARVALGTDSRASNPDLDMLQEVRLVAARYPDVPPGELVRMATLHGATALGLGGEVGSLRVGKRADFISVPLEPGRESDPYSWLR